MCGIAGLLAHSLTEGAAESQVGRMVATLPHRGPDDHGVEVGEGWGLGMRRLAIQDLSPDGHQPMTRDDFTIVFNGEVYNFGELREELRRTHGFVFESSGDTEVVLRALQAWGPRAFHRFNGMFALVLVDHERRTALLARDRFGKKPLFLARLKRGLAFASELKAIIAIAKDELRIDRDALASYFRYLYVPTPQSIFTDVRKVPQACYQMVDLSNGEVGEPSRFYAVPHGNACEVEASAESVLSAVRESTRRRLVADVPVGAFLSGGTDSSLVVACMAELAADVRTFSIGFSDPRYDESSHARAVASELGTNHTHHQLAPEETLDSLGAWADAYDEPFADSSAIPTMAVSRLARQDVTVALSGDGGDELFAGYHRYAVSSSLAAAARVPAGVGKTLAKLPLVERRRHRLKPYLSAGTLGEAYQEGLSIWKTTELERLVPGAVPASTVQQLVDEAPGGTVEQMMRADVQSYLADDILQKVDRASMAVSLEARNPLLDPEVVEVAFSGVAVAEQHPTSKVLLRNALRLLLPDVLVDRPKKGFAVPVSDWMRKELRPMVEDLVVAADRPEYDSAVASRLARDHIEGRVVAGSRLWALLAFELWRERWL